MFSIEWMFDDTGVLVSWVTGSGWCQLFLMAPEITL